MKAWIAVLCWPALWLVYSREDAWRALLAPYAPPGRAVLFERIALTELAWAHLGLVAGAMAAVLALGVPLAVWATRPSGRAFLPLLSNAVAIGQTLPPVAVLFLALPLFGFGARAVLLALFLYGLLPTVHGMLLGLERIAPEALEAAHGMGMGSRERLWRVELPLTLPALLAGVRTSTILVLATATLAPMVGANSLGTPIVAGLAVDNLALVLEGAIAVALFAVAADYGLRVLERRLTPWR